jgi:hypothetical protein
MTHNPWTAAAAVCALLVAGCAVWRPVAAPPEGGAARLPPRWLEIGGVRIDANNRELVVTGHVNQVRGVIELLACGPGGKTHESVFVVDVAPLDLCAGLALLGLRPGGSDFGVGIGPPRGGRVDVTVVWRDGGQTHEVPAGQVVHHRGHGAVLGDAEWVYNGSLVEDGRLAAEREQSLIATYWDPWAIFNLGLPCGEDDTLLEAHEPNLPPIGTLISLHISPGREAPADRTNQAP